MMISRVGKEPSQLGEHHEREPSRAEQNVARAEPSKGLARLVSLRANWRAEPRAESGVGSARFAHGSVRGSWKFCSIHFERIIAKIFHLYAKYHISYY